MIKIQICGRRPSGLTLAEQHSYMMTTHGASVVGQIAREPHLMPRRYVQNHVFDSAYRTNGGGPLTLNRDFVTQVWFDDGTQAKAAMQTPFYLDVLQPDEDNFVDQSSVVKVPSVAHELHGGSEPTSNIKLFLLLTAVDGASAETVIDEWQTIAASVIEGDPSIDRAVRNTALVMPGPAPAFHVSDEMWVTSEQAARRVGRLLLDAAADGISGTIEPGSTCLLLAREHVLFGGASAATSLRESTT